MEVDNISSCAIGPIIISPLAKALMRMMRDEWDSPQRVHAQSLVESRAVGEERSQRRLEEESERHVVVPVKMKRQSNQLSPRRNASIFNRIFASLTSCPGGQWSCGASCRSSDRPTARSRWRRRRPCGTCTRGSCAARTSETQHTKLAPEFVPQGKDHT